MQTTESSTRGWQKRRITLAVAVAVAITIAFGGCSRGKPAPRYAEAREDVSFESLPEMFATADLVVEGEVSSVSRGRTVGGEAPLNFRTVELRVIRTLRGDAGRRLRLEEVGWDGDGPIEVNGVPASIPGDHGYFFLTRTDRRSGPYRLVSSQGRFLVDGGAVRASNHESEPGASVDGATVETLEAALRQADSQVRSGEVESVATTEPERPVLTGRSTTVASGKDRGGAWTVVASRSTTGYCYGIGYGNPNANRCFTDAEVDFWVSQGKATMFRNTAPNVVLGLLPSDAVSVTLDDGVPGRKATVIRPTAMPSGWRGLKAFAVTSEGATPAQAKYTTKDGATKEIGQ